MNAWTWRSPWPQWRTHWHVWHAWPWGAQALILGVCGLCLSAAGSCLWSNDAWQAWWQADETDAELQNQLAQLHTQLRQLQTTQTSLQAQPHPSGLALPAWQALPPMDPAAQQAILLQLAQQHGLQLQAVSDAGGQWSGPLPHVLAAWQDLSLQLPQQRLLSFELKRLDAHVAARLPNTPTPANKVATSPSVLLQMDWQWTTALEKTGPLRPVALGTNLKEVVAPGTASSGPAVLHNLFAPGGLAQVLPPVAHKSVDIHGLQDQRLDEMQWVGMLSKEGQALALVKHGGLVHTVHPGQAMGQDWGEVVQIAADHLLLREWRINPLGQWQAQNTRFPSGAKP